MNPRTVLETQVSHLQASALMLNEGVVAPPCPLMSIKHKKKEQNFLLSIK